MRAGERQEIMNSQSDEQQVLCGIESQLRTEHPQLIASFLAFNGVTPPIKPLNGCYRSTPCTGIGAQIG
jgi:hypothetical protein